jgi:hypothetical protein
MASSDKRNKPFWRTLATGTAYDNYWVSHHIPRSDLQYSWITASILQSDPYPSHTQTYGHAPADGMVSSSAEGIVPAYNFVSSSDYVSHIWHATNDIRAFGLSKTNSARPTAGDSVLSTDFVGLNSNIFEPLSSSNNILGYPLGSSFDLHQNQIHYDWPYRGGLISINTRTTPVTEDFLGLHYVLNGLLLHRNGPYQYPSWKQIRTGEHPIARYHRKNNILSVQDLPEGQIKVLNEKQAFAKVPTRASTFTQYNEPPVVGRYQPVDHNVRQVGALVPTWYRYTHGNNMNLFSYNNLNKRLGLSYDGGAIYDEIFDVYNNAEITNPVQEFLGLTYKEVIYPREINTFLGRTRKREKFVVDFWKDLRINRQQTDVLNSQYHKIGTSSMWFLDSRDDFATALPLAPGTASGEGELQNNYTIFHNRDDCTKNLLGNNASLYLNGAGQYVEIVTGSNAATEYFGWFDYVPSGTWNAGSTAEATSVGGPIASSSFSISAWFKYGGVKGDVPDSDATIISKYRNANSKKQYRVSIDNTTGYLRYHTGVYSGQGASVAKVDVCDGKWHHVVATNNGENGYLWLDGAQWGDGLTDDASSGITNTGNDPDPITIGAHYEATTGSTSPTSFFKGNISNVSFWNTFLTASTTDAETEASGTATKGIIYDLYNKGCPSDLTPYFSASLMWTGLEHQGSPDGEFLRVSSAGGAGLLNYINHDQSYTWSFWVKLTELAWTRSGPTEPSRMLYCADPNYYLKIKPDSDDNPILEASVGAAGSAVSTSGTLSFPGSSTSAPGVAARTHTSNRWHHVTLVHNAAADAGTEIRLFIDGELSAVGADGTNSCTGKPNTAFLIGGAPSNQYDTGVDDGTTAVLVENVFKGFMDEVSLWNIPLSNDQAYELYSSGSPQNLFNHDFRYDANGTDTLTAWWRMGDDHRDVIGTSVQPDGTYTNNVQDQQGIWHLTASGFDPSTYLHGFVNHGPEGLDGWYRFNGVDQWHDTQNIKDDPAYVYNELVREYSGRNFERIADISGSAVSVSASYAELKGWRNLLQHAGSLVSTTPTVMFDLCDAPCKLTVLPCALGVIYCRRVPAISKLTGQELGYFPGDTLWEAGEQSGKTPFYDSYDEYREDFRGYAKDYTVIPEFRVSEHVPFYVNKKNFGFLEKNDELLTLTGAVVSSSLNSDFFEKYNHSDFLKYFDLIEDDHKTLEKEKNITLKCNALMKFLPYDGFYPAHRTLQLATLFSKSYGPFVNQYEYGGCIDPDPFGKQPSFRTFLAPLFGPGILYNSIKSGIAVDWPQMTGSYNVTGSPHPAHQDFDPLGRKCSPRISSNFHTRIPFEALVEPENYLVQRLHDMEPHPSASLDSTSSWTKSGKPLYRMGMHNFLAESVNFFLQGNNVSKFVSKPDDAPDFFNAREDKVYKMRVVLRSSDLARKYDILDRPSNLAFLVDLSGSAVAKPSMTMYDRASAFGPPTLAYGVYREESYEPFTPPYYDGYSEVELTFRPRETRRYYLDEIVSELTSSYYRIGHQFASTPSYATSPASGSKMHITASIEISNLVKLDNVSIDPITGKVGSSGQGPGTPNVWTIRPKWETPILDFSDVSVTLPTYGSGSVSKGMWHQYGVEPTNKQGIWLEIQDLQEDELLDTDTTGSLADLVGFPKKPIKLGTPAQSKEIREAIVAVPFIEERGESKFFKISKEEIDAAKLKLGMPITTKVPSISVGDSIVNMVDAMSRYVFPPKMDFLTNEFLVDPFVMYVFEFKHVLSKKDLTDIWQNLPPEIGKRFETSTATIQHGMLQTEFFNCESEIPDKLRWMVFKVKQKAEKNYFNKLDDATWGREYKSFFRYEADEGVKGFESPYSYNWPYDYFSLVEMVKLEAGVSIGSSGPLRVAAPPQQVIGGFVSGGGRSPSFSITVPTSTTTELPPAGDGITVLTGGTLSPLPGDGGDPPIQLLNPDGGGLTIHTGGTPAQYDPNDPNVVGLLNGDNQTVTAYQIPPGQATLVGGGAAEQSTGGTYTAYQIPAGQATVVGGGMGQRGNVERGGDRNPTGGSDK